MSSILEGIPDVICHMDDILIFGKDLGSHDGTLKRVLDRLRESGITLNKVSVCSVRQIGFLGHKVCGDGIALDPKKAEAVTKFPIPTCRQELRLNRMTNQMSRYIPDLAISKLMRELKESSDWVWEKAQERTFKEIYGF